MRYLVVIGLILLVAVGLARGVQAQTPAAAPAEEPILGINAQTIAAELGQPQFWVVLLVTLIAGALGGLVYELLILQGNVELPHRATGPEIAEVAESVLFENVFDLGIWARVIIGALAAVGAMLILTPETAFGLLATAVIAGSAGTSIFRSMNDRLLAALAAKEVVDTRSVADRQAAKVEAARALLAELRREVAADAEEGVRGLDEEAVGPDLEKVNQIERLLDEAKGIHDSL